jgi:hypothetical protein
MNGVTAAMLVVLGLSGPVRVPDLQVEAASASGAVLPELADAVARALVAGGARVVLRGPTSGPCPYCAKVVVKESGAGTCRVEVSQDRHFASATLRLPAGSPLFDRARAIAIQARLLVTWDTSSEGRARDAALRASPRKPEVTAAAARVAVTPDPARVEPAAPPPAPVYEPLPAAEPVLAREPPATVERRADAAPVAPPKPADRASAKPTPPAPRAEPKPLARVDTPKAEISPPEARQPPPAGVSQAKATPPSPPKPQWPWIPTAIGGGAAIAAGICALAARNRYNALSDKRLVYDSATALKSEGESWQLASFVLGGAAAVGLGVGIVGFATRSPVTAVAAPLPGGGMIAVGGDLP